MRHHCSRTQSGMPEPIHKVEGDQQQGEGDRPQLAIIARNER